MKQDIRKQLEFNRLMAEDGIMLVYRDTITEDTVQQLLEISENRMNHLGEEKKLRKRVFNVLIECLQNVVNHGYDDGDGKQGIILVKREPDAIVIKTGNLILKTDIPTFEERVHEVNQLDPDELREVYNDRLTHAEFSEKGGAGLGLLDMYRKSGHPIDHLIHPVSDEVSFLSITVKVPKSA